MTMDSQLTAAYIEILREELVPAMGCTEPIALAFGAAKAREILGEFPERCVAECSGNIIKNVKSVAIPGSKGMVGIEAALLAGLVGGRSELGMEVLRHLSAEDVAAIGRLKGSGVCEVRPLMSDAPLHIKIRVTKGDSSALIEIKHSHTNIVRIEKNQRTVFESADNEGKYLGTFTERSVLNVDAIHEFAETVELGQVRDLLARQISYNIAIAEEGLTGKFGVGIGEALLNGSGGHCLVTLLKAYTAAASEARMSGCTMPVVTNSGSGNQGIASSVPVVMYARQKGIDEEKLYRALILANLLTIHQKTLIGRLSAFCGVVCATAGSGAAITYLAGGTLEQIKKTLSNTLANTSGIICDGAKPACGAKIAASLDAAFMGHQLAMHNRSYSAGDGILKHDIEDTIAAVGRVAHEGMRETDHLILDVMLEC